MAYESVNPYNGNSVKKFETLSDEQLDLKLKIAASCYQSWKKKSYDERAKVVAKAAQLMRDNVDRFAKPETLEMGKLIKESRGEVQYSAQILDYYAKNAEGFLAPVKLHPQHGHAYVESSPIGLIFAIEPWNFPYYQLARVAGPHLMAGNTLLVKHAAIVPQCALEYEKLWADAGAPEGLYTNLFITHEQSEKIIADTRVKGVALTGSVDAGRTISARAGTNLKVSSMELGGSDAFIVLEDADLEKTIPWAVWGRMYNAGQACTASKRFIAVEAIADKFLEKFQVALSTLKPGDPMDEKTTLAPLSSESALQQLLQQVKNAAAHGAKVLMGGKRLDRPGFFMEVTILTDVKPENPAFREEFFGPVAMFFKVKDEAAAIALANDSDFGLGGAVFTQDVNRGRRVASQVETGMMFVNNIDSSDAALPFGGVKNSGYGRELGSIGIQEFVNKKLVRIHDMAAPH